MDNNIYHSTNKSPYIYIAGVGFTPPPPILTERRLLRSYANGLGLAVILYFVLCTVVPYLLLAILSNFIPFIRTYNNQLIASPATFRLVMALSYVICLLTPFLLFTLTSRIPFRVVFAFKAVQPSVVFPACCLGLGATVIGSMAAGALSVLFSFFGIVPVMGDFSLPQELGAALLMLLEVVILAPLVEEMVFRGVIMGSLRRFGDNFAIFASAMIFALIHQNLVQAPNAFLMGLLLGYFVVRTGSLWTGVLIHFVNNMLAMGTSALGMVFPRYASVITLLSFAIFLLLGIVGLLTLVKLHEDMFMVRRSNTISDERGKYGVFFTAPVQVFSLLLMCYYIGYNFISI